MIYEFWNVMLITLFRGITEALPWVGRQVEGKTEQWCLYLFSDPNMTFQRHPKVERLSCRSIVGFIHRLWYRIHNKPPCVFFVFFFCLTFCSNKVWQTPPWHDPPCFGNVRLSSFEGFFNIAFTWWQPISEQPEKNGLSSYLTTNP